MSDKWRTEAERWIAAGMEAQAAVNAAVNVGELRRAEVIRQAAVDDLAAALAAARADGFKDGPAEGVALERDEWRRQAEQAWDDRDALRARVAALERRCANLAQISRAAVLAAQKYVVDDETAVEEPYYGARADELARLLDNALAVASAEGQRAPRVGEATLRASGGQQYERGLAEGARRERERCVALADDLAADLARTPGRGPIQEAVTKSGIAAYRSIAAALRGEEA